MESTAKLESAFNATNNPSPPMVDRENVGLSAGSKSSPMERQSVKRIASSAHQAVDKIVLVASHAADDIDEKSKRVKDAGSKIIDSGRGLITEHPWASLGVAVATGFLVRHLLRFR